MNVDDYMNWTREVAVYPQADTGDITELSYLGLGLAGESGEAVEIIKKCLRKGTLPQYDLEVHEKLVKELGDVAYYWARLCKALGVLPSEVLQYNHDKLMKRKNSDNLSRMPGDRE